MSFPPCPSRSFLLFLDVLAPRLAPEPRIVVSGDSGALYVKDDVIWGKSNLNGIYLCIPPLIVYWGTTYSRPRPGGGGVARGLACW
jgi:hypothetical protein